MFFYILLLFLIVALYVHRSLPLALAGIDKASTGQAWWERTDVYLIGTLCAALIAFRALSVGIDTSTYALFYNQGIEQGIYLYSPNHQNMEIGYNILQAIFIQLGLGFRAVLVFQALVCIIPVCYVIIRYSTNPYFSFFVFIALDYFLFAMTGLRQSIAIGLTVLAFDAALKHKRLHFLLLVGLAATFHITALIFLPVYLLVKIPDRKEVYILAGIAFVLVYLTRGMLWELAGRFARIAYEEGTISGTRMLMLFILIVLSDFLLPRRAAVSRVHIALRHLTIVAIIMYPVLQFNPTAFRAHFFYTILLLLYVPGIVSGIRERWLKLAVGSAYLAVMTLYMLNYTFQNIGAIPYNFL